MNTLTRPRAPKSIRGEEVKPKLAPLEARGVPLDRCYVAPENARAGLPPENIDELAANIAEYGQLQPLIGYVDDKGNFAIVGGRRRLAALTQLKAQNAGGVSPWAEAIPFREIDQADAIGASLAENTQRVDLGVVEAALQFNRMTLDGKSAADIAKAFGVTERFVKSRMRLASLHEPILEALRKGEITLDVAQIYAGAVTARQERVWKALGRMRNVEYRVKEELKKNTLRAGDALARFVGEEAYVAAGGVVEAELFTQANDSRWLNVDLAEKLAKEKLKAKAAELEAEGFLFVEPGVSIDSSKYVDGNLGKARKPTADEKKRLTEISAREKAIDAEQRAIWKKSDEERDGDLTEEEDARIDALQAEEADLRTERERITAGQIEFDEKAKKKSGVIVTVDEDGALLITRGVVAPKERPIGNGRAPTPQKRAAKIDQAHKREANGAPMTNTTHERASRVASAVVGRSLMDKPAVAVAVIAAFLARQVLKAGTRHEYGRGASSEVLDLSLPDHRFEKTECPKLLSDKARETDRQRWLTAIDKRWDELESVIAAWPMDDQLKLLAFCVGERVRLVETTPSYVDKKERTQLAAIAKLTGADPSAHFTPDIDFLKGVASEGLQAAAREMGLDSAGCKTKGALASLIATKAPEKRWTPPIVRTLCGIAIAPVPKAKPAKKAAKGVVKKAVAKKAKVKKVAKASPKKSARAEPRA